MSAAQSESKKRNKRRYGGGGQPKRWRGARELDVGMTGVLITCNMNQKKCTAEAYDLLNEYADKLYGAQADSEGGEELEEEEDVDDALKKEVAKLQSTKQEQRFMAMDSGANNIIFIRTHNIESDKLIHYIFSDLHGTKKKKTRHVLRMIPVTGTCRAYMDDIVKFMTDFLPPWFLKPNHATYKIAFKARNSTHSKRDDVLKAVAAVVGRLNSDNKVNLTNPELTIIMEVIKSVCCVSVVRDFVAFKKYNIQELVKEPTGKSDAAPAEEATAEPGKEESAAASEKRDQAVQESEATAEEKVEELKVENGSQNAGEKEDDKKHEGE
ncbi:THUMP domain-containing protein 1 [Synchiropus splendidus]|uniref:THUMP domain-containing protein 1 n=1 Tax=Synchiropus splendidus TaxID=270530 RepID=UPI00237E1DEC|nr:THUMP domain-containing protein 1 [Synchiropus splendidus]